MQEYNWLMGPHGGSVSGPGSDEGCNCFGHRKNHQGKRFPHPSNHFSGVSEIS